jgi:hypothetical protein
MMRGRHSSKNLKSHKRHYAFRSRVLRSHEPHAEFHENVEIRSKVY